jgi:sugar phosphate isomerase/epimerase
MSADRLALEPICAMGMPPVAFIELAASLDVGMVGMAPSPITDNPHGYPGWDLRGDAGLLAETKAALAANGVAVSQGEGFMILPGVDVATSEALLDIYAELGAPSVNSVVIEPDRARAVEQFAKLAELASRRGLTLTMEFMPVLSPGSFAEGLAFVAEAGAANGKLLVDAMHFYRAGGETSELATADPSRIAYAQACDVPMPPRTDDYGEEARHERLPPGDGDLPLAAFLTALPREITVGLELPMISKARAGVTPRDALTGAVATMKELLST